MDAPLIRQVLTDAAENDSLPTVERLACARALALIDQGKIEEARKLLNQQLGMVI